MIAIDIKNVDLVDLVREILKHMVREKGVKVSYNAEFKVIEILQPNGYVGVRIPKNTITGRDESTLIDVLKKHLANLKVSIDPDFILPFHRENIRAIDVKKMVEALGDPKQATTDNDKVSKLQKTE